MVDEVDEGTLQFQGFGDKGAGGLNAAGALFSQCVEAGGGLVSIVTTCTGGDKMFSWPLWHNEAKILPRSSRMIHVRIMERSGLVKMIGEHRCPRREVSG